MLTNLLLCLLFAALAGLFAFLALRALRSEVTFIRESGIFWGGLFTLVCAAITVFVAIGIVRLYTPRSAPYPQVNLTHTDGQRLRGEHLAASYCAACHSKDSELPLSGGNDLAGDISAPIGSLIPVGLTPGGALDGWSDGEIARALRYGIDPRGRWLPAMSNNGSRYLSDEDLFAVIAFLRSQQDDGRAPVTGADSFNVLAVFLLGAGVQPLEDAPIQSPVTAPPLAATRAYGEYIVRYENCRDCHGPGLDGGLKGQYAPRGPSLRSVTIWTKEQFLTTMHSGATPRGNVMNSRMPWRTLGKLDDVELEALYVYILNAY